MSASPTKFDNAALEALVKDAGKKLRAIRSTAYTILVNQPISHPVTTDDIEFVTFGGTDLMKVRVYNNHTRSYYYKYYLTEPVEVVVVAENDNDFIEPSYLQV